MKRILSGFAAFAVLATTTGFAWGADDPLAGYYKNTMLSENQPLYVIRVWFYPDGTFKQFKASHETGTPRVAGWEGTYTVKGGPGNYQVCYTYNHEPAPASLPQPSPGCHSIAPHKIGDIWKVSYTSGPYKGTTETFAVTEGHDTQP